MAILLTQYIVFNDFMANISTSLTCGILRILCTFGNIRIRKRGCPAICIDNTKRGITGGTENVGYVPPRGHVKMPVITFL